MTTPKIVVLDGHTLNPGDLNWDALFAIGDLVVHPRTPPSAVIERAQGASILLTNKVHITKEHLDALPDLKYIGVLATGFNIVDTAAAKERGIPVTNVRGYSTPSVVQVVFALLLELTHRAGLHSDAVHRGEWSSSPDFAFWRTPLVELSGKTLGIIGFGDIGQSVAAVAKAFGMKILVQTRTLKSVDGVEFVLTPEEIAEKADVITLHCPLTDATKGMINANFLGKMKPSAFLINTGRGPLLDEKAVADAVNSGQIAGVGLDVLSAEPPPASNPLIGAKNCIITPHFAWASYEARVRLMQGVVENVKAFLEGAPKNVVNSA